MRMNEVVYTDAKPIDGYGSGFFRIGGEAIEGAVLVSPRGVTGWGGYEDGAALLDLKPEVDVILVGTGQEIAHLPRRLREELEDAGIGVEVMASGPAARSYNVLLAEGRRVAVALLPV
ncbi:Mth938-like domain-containing protein [Histidinibacterium aquaticum]|uniref:Uncharacterized protein n=1 Tax=Histidinibacterium aquaticum TaxID=2613962 RepID=A0A5J5GNY2_9RHOB|nr:Mth938-like domain-containing protein [Histidinibacterium aquaticum]KAA9009278.1 hypothetical protein F3S47_08500 [Histidinibacterium aquaticum]